ncbi:MAG TPA: aldolase/citrate lyase family protein [Pseudorhodoferax sp.]|jgi:4-hydroxy-2-oxoheptanedioate aldolase|nr:aldolase/citrate lyase family protein [Pseudorhodoferax sp.]
MPLHRPSLRERMRQQAFVVGTMVQLNCCELVEIAGMAGYDYVMLDAEHGALGIGELAQLIRAADAAGIAAMVRVPDHGAAFIQRVLDAGAAGVLVPRVCASAPLEAAVAAARFGPLGTRGACATSRAAGHWRADWPDFARQASADALVWALVEDPAGVENIAQIAAVGGLDALVFGAFDLAQSLGQPGQVHAAAVRAGFDRVRAAAQARRLDLVAITAAEPGGVRAALARGARIVLDGFDAQIVSAAYRERIQRLREELVA